MARNKIGRTDDQSSGSRFKSKPQALQLDKMARYPASLNGINKNLP